MHKNPIETDNQGFFPNISYRPLVKMRVSKLRREFGLENYQMIEKDAPDQTVDLKF
jgi:hypothetical protein